MSTAYTHLASYEAEQGELELADGHVDLALENSRKIGRRLAEADALLMKALIARKRGLLSLGTTLVGQAFGISRELGNTTRLGAIAAANGERALLVGDAPAARREFEQARARAREQDDALGACEAEKSLLEVLLLSPK